MQLATYIVTLNILQYWLGDLVIEIIWKILSNMEEILIVELYQIIFHLRPVFFGIDIQI